QGRTRKIGPAQTVNCSSKAKIGRDGRGSISNIAGDIKLTVGSGDEVVIDAIKRTRGDQSQLSAAHIVVDERPGRVEVQTEYDSDRSRRYNSINVSVDYPVLLP